MLLKYHTFTFILAEPPVKIVYPKEDVHLDRHVPEEIVLSCELSRANGSVNWFKDGQKLQDSENIKLKTEGPYRRLKILRSRVEDSGEYVCDTADDRIFFQLNITGNNKYCSQPAVPKLFFPVHPLVHFIVFRHLLSEYRTVTHYAVILGNRLFQ